VVSGRGFVGGAGTGYPALAAALRTDRSAIRMVAGGPRMPALGAPAEFAAEAWLDGLAAAEPALGARARRLLRNVPRSALLGAAAALEAAREAGLPPDTPGAIGTGLIVAGSNLAQDWGFANAGAVLAGRSPNPRHAVVYADSHQVGAVSELLGLRGPGATVGAAAASGHAALFQAWLWLRAGVVERCLVLGAATSFSPVEAEAFALLGAATPATSVAELGGPFDRRHAGFVAGEAAAAVVLEAEPAARARGAVPRGCLAGAALLLGARHGPEPDVDDEERAMRRALAAAGLGAGEIDLVSAHATGTPAGDHAEWAALGRVFAGELGRVRVNALKDLTGHTFSSAGVVAVLACLAQMEGGFLHGHVHLADPIDDQLRLVRRAEPAAVRAALVNGFGFGGFAAALVLTPA
jgi:malonyl-ACP decarboxylase